MNLHLEILPKSAAQALGIFNASDWLAAEDWYLAGGTGMALQCGHRRSVDLDFFCPRQSFSLPNLMHHLSGLPSWVAAIVEEKTVYGELSGAKISFIAYPFFLPTRRPFLHGAVKILDPADIAVMKLIAISQRGKKRDFYDLYWYLNNKEPLAEVIPCLKTQYPQVAHNYHHILKSLVYFADAESDPEPQLYFKASWEEVKRFFASETKRVATAVLGLGS